MMSRLWTFCPPKNVLGSLMLNISLIGWLEIVVCWLAPIRDDRVNDVVQQAKNLVVLDAWGKIDDDLDKGHQSNYERNPVFDDKILHFTSAFS